MKLPWVSRIAFEIAIESRDHARVDAHVAQRALQDLTAKYHQLRLQGQAAPEPKPEPPAPREVDPLIAAINERTAGDPKLRAAALSQLKMDRASGMTDDDILQCISGGMSVFDEGTLI